MDHIEHKKVSSDKLFGRYNEFVLLIFGFALTGLVGNYISQSYAHQSAAEEFSSSLFKEEMVSIGDRVYVSENLFSAIQARAPGQADDARLANALQNYRIELLKWNSFRSYSREMISEYFGDDAWNKERSIHYHLRALGAALERAYRTRSMDTACLDARRDDLLVEVGEFSRNLGDLLRRGEVGSKSSVSGRSKIKFAPEFCLPSAHAKPIIAPTGRG